MSDPSGRCLRSVSLESKPVLGGEEAISFFAKIRQANETALVPFFGQIKHRVKKEDRYTQAGAW